MARSEFYKIIESLSDEKALQNDITAAASQLYGSLYDKYVKRLNCAIAEYHNEAQNNPNNEIRLMTALKPYFNEDGNKNLDTLIEAMNKAEVVRRLMSEIKPITVQQPYLSQSVPDASSIHKDGVYDVDMECLKSKKKSKPEYFQVMLMMFAMRMGS